jgi:RND family efflux transporter MFP subunit
MKDRARILLPVAVLLAAGIVMTLMITLRRSAETERPPVPAPLVEVQRAEPGAVGLWVSAQGTVEPATESDLVAEVAGRIVWTSPQLASGGFLEKGDVLVRIDPRDYEVALDGARAALARAESALHLAESVLERQRSMRGQGISSQARLDDATHARENAAAGVREARVAVRRAELDLERTRIHAPFAGRVRQKHVDLGQFVNRGAPIARVYSIDYAEVRLPVRDADLAYLELPAGFGASSDAEGPQVHLSAEIAGKPHLWRARLVRTEGVRDERTRMLNVVARVDDPYVREGDPDRSPLPIGLFVNAAIEGRRVEGVFELPRSALRRGDAVLVVGDGERLEVRPVDVLRTDRDRAWIRAGLAPGERVVVTPLDVATDGMAVRVMEAPPAARDTARDVPPARAEAPQS